MIYENVDGNTIKIESDLFIADFEVISERVADARDSISSSDWDADTRTTITTALGTLIDLCGEAITALGTLKTVGGLIIECKNIKAELDKVVVEKKKAIAALALSGIAPITAPISAGFLIKYDRQIDQLEKELAAKDGQIKGLLGIF